MNEHHRTFITTGHLQHIRRILKLEVETTQSFEMKWKVTMIEEFICVYVYVSVTYNFMEIDKVTKWSSGKDI